MSPENQTQQCRYKITKAQEPATQDPRTGWRTEEFEWRVGYGVSLAIFLLCKPSEYKQVKEREFFQDIAAEEERGDSRKIKRMAENIAIPKPLPHLALPLPVPVQSLYRHSPRPLRLPGNLVTDSAEKDEVFNASFVSLFTNRGNYQLTSCQQRLRKRQIA